MLRDLIASTAGGETILDWIEMAALAIEIIAVAIIMGAIVYAIARFLLKSIFKPEQEGQYQKLKVRLGKALLLGLEILVAATIVKTITIEPTPAGLGDCAHRRIPRRA